VSERGGERMQEEEVLIAVPSLDVSSGRRHWRPAPKGQPGSHCVLRLAIASTWQPAKKPREAPASSIL
jgi:hypothetical protein